MSTATPRNNSNRPPRAYSYLRFSTPEQSKGDSERRQIEMARDYAQKNGLELDEDLMLADRGVSGRHGQNAVTGALSLFIDAVRREVVPPGSVLLVESLDRLSRDQVLAAQRRFLEMLELGITIVTLGDNRTYSYESLNDNPTELIVSILVMMRAHEESETKSRRLKDSWTGKRKIAQDNPDRKLTKRCPAWLRLAHDRKSFVPIEERVKIIRQMFDMAIAGHGQHAIAKQLQSQNIPTWGDQETKRKPAAFWQRSYVKKILENPAVIGTFIPHAVDYNNPEKRKRRKALKPITDYFPAIVDQETFQQVQDLLRGKTSQPRGRHANAPTQNVLAGLARCPLCKGTMTRVTKGSRAKAGRPYLVCTKAKVGACGNHGGLSYHAVPMTDVEDALLGFSRRVIIEAMRPGLNADLEQIRADLLEQLGENALAIEVMLDALKETPKSKAIREKLGSLEADRERIEHELTDVMRKLDRAGGRNIGRRLEELASALAALTTHRQGKAQQVLVEALGQVSRRPNKKARDQRRWIDLPASSGGRQLGNVIRTEESKGRNVEAIGRANKALRDVLSRVEVDYLSGKLMLHWHHMPEPSAVPLHSPIRASDANADTARHSVVATRPSKQDGTGLKAIELTFLGGKGRKS